MAETIMITEAMIAKTTTLFLLSFLMVISKL